MSDMLLPINPVGFVTKDPVLRESKDQKTKYLRLNLAVDKGFGEKKRTILLQATFYGAEAERIVRAKVKKGSCIQMAADVEDVIAFAKEDSGELVAMIKLRPLDWKFGPLPSKKETDPDSKGTVDKPPVNPEDFPEVQCGDDGELPE